MNVVIAGSSGHLGRLLEQWLRGQGHEVKGLSRSSGVIWDGRTRGDWCEVLEGIELLVNLAGRSVNCRCNVANRREIFESRIASTRALGEAVAQCAVPPKVWLNSSTATIYRHAEDHAQDESAGEIGKGFSVEVAKSWEGEFFEHSVPGVRMAALRTAMVMAPGSGGPFDVFRRLAKRGVRRMGSGMQRVSWVHGEDFCRAVHFLAWESNLEGVVNVSAPNTPTNKEFLAEIRRAQGGALGWPVPAWMLEVGAWFLRTETELPLKSRWVSPGRLLEAGFQFSFPDWAQAAGDLVRRRS